MKQIMKLIAVILENLPEMSGEVIQKWIENPKAVKEVLSKFATSETVQRVLQLLDRVNLPFVSYFPKMQSPDCLKVDGKVIVYRDPDLDSYLKGVPAIKEGKVSVFQLTKKEGAIFREMAQAILGMEGNDDTLKQNLKAKGHTFHLEQINDLIHRTEKGENTGLLTNGSANIFFIEDDKDKVFVVVARRYSDGWYVCVVRFGVAYRWLAGHHVFARNLSA